MFCQWTTIHKSRHWAGIKENCTTYSTPRSDVRVKDGVVVCKLRQSGVTEWTTAGVYDP